MQTERRLRLPEPPHGWLRYYGHLLASPNYSYGGLNMLNQIQLKRYAELSGYTEKALRDKISTGVWVEGLHYYRAPDRHILINVKEVEKWQRNECQPA